jgi:hypothetical protein
MDICKKCNRSLPIERLVKDKNAVKGYRSTCLECLSFYRKTQRKYRPRKNALPRNAQINKDYLDNLRDVPCLDCGNRFPPCAMDFDHINEKAFSIMSHYRDKTIEELAIEVAKCEIVCACCHRIRTHARRM